LADYEPGPDCGQDLIQMAVVRHRLDLLMAELAGTHTDAGLWDEDGYTTLIQWLREEAKVQSGIACRFLKLSPQDDGALMFRGWLDPEGGSLLRSALEPLARKSGVGDDRTREQRLADALVEATTGDHETELVVTCTLETLQGRAGSPAAQTEWGGLLSGETVERLVCGGASLRRLVLDGDGVVIDFGRRRRLLSPQARRALEARDKHCVWPGCDRPPRWCDTHHKIEWRKGAPTSVEESALLCGRHHWLRHDGGWQLFRTPGGRWKAISPLPPRWSSLADLPSG
jgi:hypothetical protein